MKKRMPKLMALVLTLALCFGSVQSVFAAGTYEGVDEKDLESKVYKFMEDTKKGGYDVVKTDTLKSWIDKGDDMVIVDTMPDDSYNGGHVPTAVGSVVGHPDDYYKFENDTQKKNFKEMVESQIPNKTVWVKVSKSQYNKLAKANRKTKKVNGKTVYYKKTVGKDKDYKIVVYCGYIKCARSHTGAAYLRSLGYTNVYRYGGGISAWKAAEYEVESQTYVNAEYVNSKLKDPNVVLLDVRAKKDYAEGHVSGAVSASTLSDVKGEKTDGAASDNIKAAIKKYGTDKEYLLLCYSGNRYANAATKHLVMNGVDYANIKILKGGMTAWGDAGYEKVTE